jgi:hypothetical protein
VDFLQITLEEGRPFAERTVEDLGDGLTHVSFDFKDRRPGKFDFSVELDKLAAVMKSIAAVREYRSPAEIKAMNERTRREKMREYGAESAWQYFLIRRRRDLERLGERMSPRLALARLRRKKYDHVLSLGMNCESAFRFSLSWGFVESTPFSWASCKRLETLAAVLRDPGLIGRDGFLWDEPNLMWRCRKTDITFHGKLQGNGTPAQEALENDKTDLVQRLAHLNEKFTRMLSDASSKALILRIHTKVALDPDIGQKIDAVQHALEERGARNCTLVVVTEAAAHGRIPAAPNRVVRSVKAFNPNDSVVKPKLGDPIGWKALYTEFSPAKILPKRHPFKFEKA